MIKKLLIATALLGAFALGQAGKRFEELSWEYPSNGSNITTITTWHDRQSGIEFICALGPSIKDGWNQPVQQPPMSCFVTGRKWQ
jgi:hypothetical protein